MQAEDKNNVKIGFLFALGSYICWGVFPLFWRMLDHINGVEILSHRVMWSAMITGFILYLQSPRNFITRMKVNSVQLLLISFTAILVASNWGLYLYAVKTRQLVEASLGYFISPLLSVAMGTVILGEHLSRKKWISIFIAAAGVVVLSLRVHHIPWISLYLAFSFVLYGLIRKKISVTPLVHSTWESILLSPIAVLALFDLNLKSQNLYFFTSTRNSLLLILAGACTAVPFWWYSEGAKRLKLSTIGIMQFLSPTIQFLIAVFVFREKFDFSHASGFIMIWIALAVYSSDLLAQGFKKTTRHLKIA